MASSAANGSSISSTAGRNARDLNALLHAAGELPGVVVGVRLETNQPQRVTDPLLDFGTRQLALQSERDVAADRAPLQQRVRVVLKDDDDISRRTVDQAAVHTHGAARAGRQAAKQAQQRRLARSRRTNDGQDLAAAQLERDVIEDAPRALPVRQLDRRAPARENQIGFGSRRPAGALRSHGAVTTILALSIGTDSCPRSLSTSIQTPSSSGLMVKR
jgi:hypothetical protein